MSRIAKAAAVALGTGPVVISGAGLAMADAGGNRTQAAERLGIRRQLLYQKLARYGLDPSPNGTARVSGTDSDTAEDTPDA